MFHHPDQLMALNNSHLHELKAEHDHWQFATKVMQAQQPADNPQPHKLGALRIIVRHVLHKLARPAWQTAVKPG